MPWFDVVCADCGDHVFRNRHDLTQCLYCELGLQRLKERQTEPKSDSEGRFSSSRPVAHGTDEPSGDESEVCL